MGRRRTARDNRPSGRDGATPSSLERAVAALEAALDPLFTAGHYREFFDRVHATRQSFRTTRLAPVERERLWARLNRLTEAAKERQAAEFAARNAANLARWREQLATAERYTDALHAEIGELAARRGPPAELARWQRRIDEKQARLASVQATIAELQRKIQAVGDRQ